MALEQEMTGRGRGREGGERGECGSFLIDHPSGRTVCFPCHVFVRRCQFLLFEQLKRFFYVSLITVISARARSREVVAPLSQIGTELCSQC